MRKIQLIFFIATVFLSACHSTISRKKVESIRIEIQELVFETDEIGNEITSMIPLQEEKLQWVQDSALDRADSTYLAEWNELKALQENYFSGTGHYLRTMGMLKNESEGWVYRLRDRGLAEKIAIMEWKQKNKEFKELKEYGLELEKSGKELLQRLEILQLKGRKLPKPRPYYYPVYINIPG